MRNRFDEQLKTLNNELITMGALCEEAIKSAVSLLFEDNKKYLENSIETDRQIDKMENDIGSLCLQLLLHQQPVATDLRVITSALRMISDMERIGDQAADIAEIAECTRGGASSSKIHISDMADATVKMVSESVDSFVKKDIDLAYAVLEHDNIVDDLFDRVKNELITAIEQSSDNVEALIDLLMIAKYFERIGDHAENIAEWVIYSISGTHPKNADY